MYWRPEEYGEYDVRQTAYTLGAGVSQVIALNDPSRVCLVMAFIAGGVGTLSTAPVAVLNQGIALAANQIPTIFETNDHGVLPCLAWSAISGPGTTVNVIEVFLRRQPVKEVPSASTTQTSSGSQSGTPLSRLLDRLRIGKRSQFPPPPSGLSMSASERWRLPRKGFRFCRALSRLLSRRRPTAQQLEITPVPYSQLPGRHPWA